MPQQATLQSPDGKQKTVVDVGSSQASQLQSSGWVLGAPQDAAIVMADQALKNIGTPVAEVPVQGTPVAPPVPTSPTAPPAPPTAPAPPQAPTAPKAPTAPPQTQQATLTSPDGKSKTVVNVGSSEASQLQTRGWKLDASGQSVLSVQDALGMNQTPTNPIFTDGGNGGEPTDGGDGTDFNLNDLGGFNFNDYTTDPVNQSILEKYGITAPKVSDNPVTSYADTYKQLLGTMGITNIKSEFEKTQQKFADLQTELNDKISEINDDPWLTEGVRVGRIRSLQDKYEGRLQILTDQQKLYQSMYEQGVQEAQFVANAAFNQQQFDAQQSFNVAQLALQEQEARTNLRSTNLRDQLAIAQEMRLSAAQDSDDVQKTTVNSLNSLATLADMFGGDFINKLSDSEKRKWEQAAGLFEGTMDRLGKTIKERQLSGSASGLDVGQMNSTINQIAGSFDNEQIVKDYNIILAKNASVQKILNSNSGGSGDLAVVYEFMKALDPTSVVRESEYDSAAKSGNVFQGALAKLNGLFTAGGGKLDETTKANIKSIINSKLEVQQALYDNLKTSYQQRIDSVKAGGFNSLTDYGAVTDSLITPPTTTTLPALNASYSSIDALLKKKPEYQSYIIQQVQNGLDEASILRELNKGQPVTFSSGSGGTPTATIIANAIKKTESNGNYSVKGASGEYGAYQFMPSTWSSWAKKYLGNDKAPMTPANQDKVAMAKIQELLDQGYNAQQIALIWNGGTPVIKKGVNAKGVAYDSGAYAQKVLVNLNG